MKLIMANYFKTKVKGSLHSLKSQRGSYVKFSNFIKDKFVFNDINFITTSSIYNKETFQQTPPTVNEYDGHPFPYANHFIAEYLIRNEIIE